MKQATWHGATYMRIRVRVIVIVIGLFTLAKTYTICRSRRFGTLQLPPLVLPLKKVAKG